ncbi:hypothetical protein [Helicobacter rodentium]|uniref:hypothetical protein n=1 Tax=Helicobacter rodentium TaxID=59617 RepID=UPI0023F58CE7|nr:hypothetical protein [Helicobacter rodentium]
MESNVWAGIEKRKALRELVLDSISARLAPLIARVALREVGDKAACVIVFKHNLALAEWNRTQSQTLERMRELYKERNLKQVVVFNAVKVEVEFKPIQKENPKQETLAFKEQSSGNFTIHCQDESMRKIFLKIQENIKNSLARERGESLE